MVETRIDPTILDFNEIKQSLVDYLSTKITYQDFDFEGSNISIILDQLAYNTHIQAINAYINFNETNIESAQLRGNVVTRASALGYKPRSKIASKAIINIVVNNPIGADTSLTLPRGTRLTTTLNNTEYAFVITETYSVNKSIDGRFRFNNIPITQGTLKTNLFIYDDREQYPKFTIPDYDIDTNTLSVDIKSHDSATNYITYSKYNNLSEIASDSKIYYIDENYDGQFCISFGDNIVGKKLSNNNVIRVQYVSTKGVEVNGAKLFTMSEAIGGNSDVTVSTVSISGGGLGREDIETVRYNSKRLFSAQDRCVTESDYQAIISNQFDDIETIAVYGGENLPTPQYGRTYIAIKPFYRDALSSSEKDFIKDSILRPKQVGTITPILIDPNYTYLSVKVDFKYNPNNTSLSKLDLSNLIKNIILAYNDTTLQKFSGVFRYSNLVAKVDNSDASITSNVINVEMYKEITPKNNDTNYFELNYTNKSLNITTTDFTVSSSPIIINSVAYFLGDKPITEEGKRQLFLYRIVDGKQQTLISDVGYLIQEQGLMVLKNFTPDTTDVIKIFVKPNSLDLAPKYNQLLRIGLDEIQVNGEIDTISVGGSGLGAINYNPTPK